MRCQFKKNGILALNHTPTQAPTVSLRGPAQDVDNERKAGVESRDVVITVNLKLLKH